MNESSTIQGDKGFTLIEILIAIVLVGILSAVAVVGISNLVSKGTTSSCQASADAAKAATAVYFADTKAYPATLGALVTNGALQLPSGVTAAGTATATTGASWTLTMAAGTGGAAPTFTCSVP